MHPEHATTAQRVGMVLTFLEACAFGLAAALHFGLQLNIAGRELAAPFLYPAAIVEALLGLALFLAILLPADGTVRAGRVLGAQILAVIGLFVLQVALVRGSMVDMRKIAAYGGCLVVSLVSIALIAAPATRRTITR
jgi:hypothetical protein